MEADTNSPADPPKELCCPLSLDLFADPVVLVDSGETYERAHILRWLQSLADRGAPLIDPCTRQALGSAAVASNQLVRRQVHQWCERHGLRPPVAPPAPAANRGTGPEHPASRSLVGMLSSSNSSIQRAALETLCCLMREDVAHVDAAAAIPPLVRLLSHQDAALQAVEAISRLATDAHATSIADAGAIPPLVRLLGHEDAAGRRCAGTSVHALAVCGHAMRVVEAGAVPFLVRQLDDRKWQTSAAATLGVLARDAACGAAIVAAGALPRLVQLLDVGADEGDRWYDDVYWDPVMVQWNTQYVICHLVKGSAANATAVVAAGAIIPLVRLLHEDDSNVYAAEAICTLAETVDASRCGIVAAGAVPRLQHLAEIDDPEMQDFAERALAHLLPSEPA